MNTSTIEHTFRQKVSEQVRVISEGMSRFRVFTPFHFDDGDHLAIVLRQERDGWSFSDEGHTFMHLTYSLDEKSLHQGTRRRIIDNALSVYKVEERQGELVLPVSEPHLGDGLFSFVQALMKISDVSFLSRERVRSTFMEDFRALIAGVVPAERLAFDWISRERDEQGKYPVDCRINGMARPLFVYALTNDDRVRDATIAMHQYEKWGTPHVGVGIFEDQERINRKVLARFSDMCDKQFSSLSNNRDRISGYIGEHLRAPLQ